ncbi:MMPL family transporter [Chengkuizengella axinellae]|uniref:MMPL family transporter n=1 Tax=Chengkuizengella axinellae TaxID=3064388 RepID=A0ABT9J322_9BACL|nr:MMPL family transporter [Chengkuizengella sp. 2205SS18-9]MDP5276021.1 MMPL family transporter [Chengkuizengella sp. 2205SS18-9]
MKHMIKLRWVLVVFWVVATLLLVTTMPSLDDLLREKGQPKIPDGYSSVLSVELLNELNGVSSEIENIDAVVVFYEKEGINETQLQNIEDQINDLTTKQEDLGISNILTHFDNEELKEQLVSPDETTIITALSIDKSGKKVSEIREELQKELSDSEVTTYITGSEFINEDQIQTTEDGVKKTELFTVIFIIIVLIIVFRSPITPIISLLTVGVTYICSLSIVAHLVYTLDFPFSTITQTFLILVLFGIGTDYNILLLSRFKEEISKGFKIKESIINTYKTAGKTVIYSGLAVFIGFSILGLAKFSVFQSASAVAVAVGILLLALFTLMPFFMMVMGRLMFWPVKEPKSHGENKLWSRLGQFSTARPFVSVILVAILTIPFLFMYEGNVSYNSVDEVSDAYESVQGFNLLSDKFSPGKALPTTVVIDANEHMDSNEHLDWIDELTQKMINIEGVEAVYSPTRPKGEKIEELYSTDQVEQVSEGLVSANDGVAQIAEGLSEAEEQLSNSADFSNVDKLIVGTNEIAGNVNQLQSALQTLNEGIANGTVGARQLEDAMKTLSKSLSELNQSSSELHTSYGQLQSGYSFIATEYDEIMNQMMFIRTSANGMQGLVVQIEKAHPEVAVDPNMMTLKTTIEELVAQLNALILSSEELNTIFKETNDAFTKANEGLSQMTQGQTQLSDAAVEIEQSISTLADGLEMGSEGQSEIILNLGKIEKGIQNINDGQIQLKNGLVEASSGMIELEVGLSKSTEGLDDISYGLVEATNFLEEMTETDSSSTFYIPSELLEGEYQEVLDLYMSEDREVFKLSVELSVDPYSTEAMEVMNALNEVIDSELQDLKLENARFALGGISSMNDDLNTIATEDFVRTVTLMLIGIFIVLVWIIRGFWIPVYIIVSLILGYYTALSFTELLVVNVFGLSGLSWSIPFFSFIMVIALGVDYSIFLMMRYKEYTDMSSPEALLLAKKKIGGVVISAAIILCGTFAAMYPAGVLTLTQMSTVVITGLTLLTVVMLPMLIPALVSIQSKLKQKEVVKGIEKNEVNIKTHL